MQTRPLEAAVVHSICTQLGNLGWTVDEFAPRNNVTQQRVKTEAQRQALRSAASAAQFPDFVLYEEGTSRPVAVIEAKRPGASLLQALGQAKRYALPIQAPLAFAYNNTFVESRHIFQERGLKIDGEDVRQFVDHYTSLRFVHEGPEILSGPESVQIPRSELIKIFKRQANLLREDGLTAGLERFGAFSDVLFLKLMDELCQLREHSGETAPLLPHLRWSDFQNRNPTDRHEYVVRTVWPAMRERFGMIFSDAFPIRSAEVFDEIVEDLSRFNFTGTDADVKGDAFEYFLKNAYQGIKVKDLGEYFTPRNVVRTMVSMADPKFGESVYDPFCGTGGFLIEAFRYVSLRIKVTPENEERLKAETVFGSEITATARIARMNMVLFGDGHSNVELQDSFANPVDGQHDVVLTNPPYSQATKHGRLYPIPSTNGDAVAMQHCLTALKPDGRAAILVKEDFLTEGGDTGRVREMVLKAARNITVVSLPRRLFEPYTPTKTSILYFERNREAPLYFEKRGKRDRVFFFVVHDVGHTLGARPVSTAKNDLPAVLESHGQPEGPITCDGLTAERSRVVDSGSLWPYDYTEVLPARLGDLVLLGDHIEESGGRFRPGEQHGKTFHVLGVSNTKGVFLNMEKGGGGDQAELHPGRRWRPRLQPPSGECWEHRSRARRTGGRDCERNLCCVPPEEPRRFAARIPLSATEGDRLLGDHSSLRLTTWGGSRQPHIRPVVPDSCPHA